VADLMDSVLVRAISRGFMARAGVSTAKAEDDRMQRFGSSEFVSWQDVADWIDSGLKDLDSMDYDAQGNIDYTGAYMRIKQDIEANPEKWFDLSNDTGLVNFILSNQGAGETVIVGLKKVLQAWSTYLRTAVSARAREGVRSAFAS
jgi:hypothetical protein